MDDYLNKLEAQLVQLTERGARRRLRVRIGAGSPLGRGTPPGPRLRSEALAVAAALVVALVVVAVVLGVITRVARPIRRGTKPRSSTRRKRSGSGRPPTTPRPKRRGTLPHRRSWVRVGGGSRPDSRRSRSPRPAS